MVKEEGGRKVESKSSRSFRLSWTETRREKEKKKLGLTF